MIVEFMCRNDDCPELLGLKDIDEDTGEVLIEDADRKTWFGGYLPANQVNPAEFENDECPLCGAAGEEVGRYTPRELREEMEL